MVSLVILLLSQSSFAQLSKDCVETTDPSKKSSGIRTFHCTSTSSASNPTNEAKELKTLLAQKREEVAGYITSYVYSITESQIKDSNGKVNETFKSKSGALLLEDITHEVNQKRNGDQIQYDFNFTVDESVVRKKMDQLMSNLSTSYVTSVMGKLQSQIASCDQVPALDMGSFDACKSSQQIAFQKSDQFMKEHSDDLMKIASEVDKAQKKLLEISQNFKKRRLDGSGEKIRIGSKDTTIANAVAFVKYVESLIHTTFEKHKKEKTNPALDIETIEKLHDIPESTPYGLKYSEARKFLRDWNFSYFREVLDKAGDYKFKPKIVNDYLESSADYSQICICVPVKKPEGIATRSKGKQSSYFTDDSGKYDLHQILGVACNNIIAPFPSFDPWLWLRNNNVEIRANAGSVLNEYVPVDGARRLNFFRSKVGAPGDSCSESNPKYATQSRLMDRLETTNALGGFRVNKDSFDEYHLELLHRFSQSKEYKTKIPDPDKYKNSEKFQRDFDEYRDHFTEYLKFENPDRMNERSYVSCD